jgi:hypothetical protein
MITKFDKFLNESPDQCYFDGDYINYENDDAIAFGYYKGVLGFSKFSEWHCRIFGVSRDKLINPGRLWKDHKIIAFWDIDPRTSLKQTVDDINNKALSLKDNLPEYYFQIDDSWVIEVRNKETYNDEIYNLFDFIKIAPSGSNIKYSAKFNSRYEGEIETKINIRDFLPSFQINDKPLQKRQYKYDN